MYKTDQALQLGGRLRYTQFTITYQDLQAIVGSGAQPLNLTDNDNPGYTFTITRPAAILAVGAVLITKFTGGAISAMTVSLGVTGTITAITAAFNLFQTPSATTIQDTAGLFYAGATTAKITPIATFTPTGDTLANCTAGQVTFNILWLDCTTTFTEPA